jgi:branched-chain amino acid transport system ATP-binding protein
MTDELLVVNGLAGGYDGLAMVADISFTIETGDLIALIGPNGAGKTTLMGTLAGLNPALAGSITCGGSDLTRQPARRRARAGITLVPEGRHLFSGLTVRENLELGASAVPQGKKEAIDLVVDLFPALVPLLDRPSGALSGGEQQMCAIGRGLMARPRLLMIDELSLGLAPVVVSHLLRSVERIHRELKLAVMFVEQDAAVALATAERAIVISRGRVVMEGDAALVKAHQPALERAFLGVYDETGEAERAFSAARHA